MKKLFVYAAALALFACAPASAQNDNHGGDRHDSGASRAAQGSVDARGGGQNHDARGAGHAAMQQNTARGHAATTTRSFGTQQNMSRGHAATTTRSAGTHQNTPAVAATQNRFLPASGNVRPVQAGRSMANGNRNNSGWSGNTNNRQSSVNSRQGNSGWAGKTATRQPSINSLRLNVQATRRFHSSNYLQPAGYQSRHWGYGERLPRSYFARNYWITDFSMFGLFAPPTDLIWVRVGDDALLIDRYSGDIVQVDYGVFY